MSLPKLGEVTDSADGGKWIVTSRYPHGAPHGLGFVVYTPIPEGMAPEDLGHRFKAASVSMANMEENERLYEWPKETK